MYLGTDGEPLEPLNDLTGKKSIPLAVVNEATLKALGFTPADKKTCTPPYDKAAHVKELEEAGIPTRLYTAETGNEFSAIIADEVGRMKRKPLSEDGRDLLSYWLGNAKDLSYHGVSDTRAARYIGGMAARWEHKHTVQVLQALHTVLLFHVQKDTGMVAAVNALIPPDGKHVTFDDPSGPIPWWHAKFMRLQDIGYAVGSRFDNEKVGAGYRTADLLIELLYPAKPEIQEVVEPERDKTLTVAEPVKRGYTSWPKSAQETLGKLWSSFRTSGGTREFDCYEAHKETSRLPECIKSFDDFQKCKESAERNSIIPPLKKKRGKAKGKPCQ